MPAATASCATLSNKKKSALGTCIVRLPLMSVAKPLRSPGFSMGGQSYVVVIVEVVTMVVEVVLVVVLVVELVTEVEVVLVTVVVVVIVVLSTGQT